ncbi:hypothetical protein LTR08_000571 [Meristemomyces frigidus]|nr:hypothetical protein LTR08_000571 [Meristemomyces frigidus]
MVGRPCRYDWDDKYDICYQLYVEQKKSPREVVEYFAQHFSCAQSKLPGVRLFRRQFSEKWHFPSRKGGLGPEDEGVVVARIGQLWEQNRDIKSIRGTLEEEGWELGHHELLRLRKKHGFLRRGEAGAYGLETEAGKGKRKRGAEEMEQWLPVEDGGDELMAGGVEGRDTLMAGLEAPDNTANALLALHQLPTHAFTPDDSARHVDHLARIQHESDQALFSRQRRRRIRGYGHLGPDDPALAPRYNSETTLDECKAFLSLTNDMYTALRAAYEVICQDMGIERKKTVLENGTWQASKDRLVRESMHLSAIMHPLQPDLDRKAVAIDVLCADVTKRIRDSAKKLTVADANNILGLNPTASKALRRQFYDILAREGYTTRLACGEARWAELRHAWFELSPELLRLVVAEGDAQKMKCVDILCRDATKRYNDDEIKRDPGRRLYGQDTYGPGPGSCRSNRKKETPNEVALAAKPAAAKKTAVAKKKKAGGRAATVPGEMVNLDPTLALAPVVVATPPPIPAYFRLAPESQLVGNHPRLWLGKLAAPTVAALHVAGSSQAGAAKVSQVRGLVKNADGGEDGYVIEDDRELQAYLEAAGEKRTFVVLLEGGVQTNHDEVIIVYLRSMNPILSQLFTSLSLKRNLYNILQPIVHSNTISNPDSSHIMSLFRTSITASLRQTSRVSTTIPARTFSDSARLCKEGPAPGNQPPSAKSAGKTTHLADDPQSSASKKDPDEQKTGDDHPAKQPDTQEEPTRSTGFQNFKGGVKGGKEGLASRSDKEGGPGTL